MPLLSRASVKHRCLTCLLKLDAEAAANALHTIINSGSSEAECQQTELKNLSINIATNAELAQQLNKYLELEQQCQQDWPQQLCLQCYKKLQNFEKFHRRAHYAFEKLLALLKSDLHEVDYDEVEDHIYKEIKLDEETYNALLKNTLLETESVLLEHAAKIPQSNLGLQLPDPFDTLNGKTTQGIKCYVDHVSEDVLLSDEGDEIWLTKITEEDNIEKEFPKEMNNGKTVNTKRKPVKTKRQQAISSINQLNERMSDVNDASRVRSRNKGKKNTFRCCQCNHSFAHKITLDAHVRKVHEGSKRPFKCDRCDKSYTFIGGLYTHIKEIHEAEVRSYSCDYDGCDRIYTSFIAMQKHKRLKHTDPLPERKYVCEQCGATFNQSGNLKYHRRSKHPTEAEAAEKELEKQSYYCDICQKQFHSRYTLKYHTMQLHSADDSAKYECKECGRRMAKKFMLMQHMLVHSTEKMPCEHCGKLFIRKFELEAHIRTVHMKLKPFACKHCSESFASRKTLRHHEYIHTGEKPYVCDICGQAYRQQTCLKNHRKSHEKISAEALLTENINRTLITTFLVPTTQTTVTPESSTNMEATGLQ